MLGCSDKITLCAINFTNKDGEIVNYHLPFPIKEDFELPNDIIGVSIFETHLGICNYGFTAFNIYVGNITTIKGTIDHYNTGKGYKIIPDNIKSIDDKLCYYNDNHDNWIVFAKINEGDIVVKDLEELKMVLITISNNFENIKEAISNIKKANEITNYSLTTEDEEIMKKRREVCIRERKKERVNNILEDIIKHNEEIAKISSNLDYINWLKEFTKKHGNFCSDSWTYNEKDITEEDLANVNKLCLFYEVVEEYASEMHIEAIMDEEDNGYHYLLKHDDSAFNIGFMSGQGTIFYCESTDNFEDAIDFNYIVAYNSKRKPKTRKKTI